MYACDSSVDREDVVKAKNWHQNTFLLRRRSGSIAVLHFCFIA